MTKGTQEGDVESTCQLADQIGGTREDRGGRTSNDGVQELADEEEGDGGSPDDVLVRPPHLREPQSTAVDVVVVEVQDERWTADNRG